MRALNVVKIVAVLAKNKTFFICSQQQFFNRFFFCNWKKINDTLANVCFPADNRDFRGLENDKQGESCVCFKDEAIGSSLFSFLKHN